jgi:peptide/nickel transport system permease protein
MTITFFLYKSIPGDPVAVLLGPEGMQDIELVEALTKYWMLDKPVYIQYLAYLGKFFRGDLGISLYSGRLVIEDLKTRFPATVELVIFGFLIAMVIGIPAGILSSKRRGSKIDQGTRVFSIVGVCAPQFWWGIIFLLIFYLYLGPPLKQYLGINLSTGRISYFYDAPKFVTGLYTIDSLIEGNIYKFLDALQHIILPAFTIGITSCGLTMRLTRSSMLEVLNSDYIRTARMKGLSERIVLYKHALKNALMPTVTYIGPMFGGMLGGSIMVETVFNWQGIGLWAVNVLFANDIPGLMGVIFFMAIIYTTTNLIVDLLYGILDPRVRYG